MFSDSSSIFIGMSLLATVFIAEFKWLESKAHNIRLFLLLSTSLLTLWLTEQKDQKKDIEQKKEKVLNDSLYQARLDSAVGKVVATFGNAIGKYNLKLDSGLNGVVKLVRDSAKRVINQSKDTEPYFGLCVPDSGTNYEPITIIKGENSVYQLKMQFCALYASAIDIKVKLLAIVKKDNEYAVHIEEELLGQGFQLFENMIKIEDFHFKYSKTQVYFFIYGDYYNASKTKKFIINDLRAFNLNECKEVGISKSEEMGLRKDLYDKNKGVKMFFKKNGIEF